MGTFVIIGIAIIIIAYANGGSSSTQGFSSDNKAKENCRACGGSGMVRKSFTCGCGGSGQTPSGATCMSCRGKGSRVETRPCGC